MQRRRKKFKYKFVPLKIKRKSERGICLYYLLKPSVYWTPSIELFLKDSIKFITQFILYKYSFFLLK